MPNFVPNYSNAAFSAQSEIDSVDFDILLEGISGDGVLSGCSVTAKSPASMNLAVASGTVRFGTTTVSVTGADVTVTTANATNPRFDLVTVNTSGTLSVTAGTAAAQPVFPSIPANSVVLAAVYVPANDTAIASDQIIDKRVVTVEGFLKDKPATGVAAGDWNEYTSGSSSASVPSGKTYIRELLIIGGGGGGGGGNSGTSGSAGGSGGGGGAIIYARWIPVTAGATYTYSVGAAGGGGAATANGTAGGNSTFTVGAYSFTATGGAFGSAGASGGGANARTGGVGGSSTEVGNDFSGAVIRGHNGHSGGDSSNGAGTVVATAGGVGTASSGFGNDTAPSGNAGSSASGTGANTSPGAAGAQGYAGGGGGGGGAATTGTGFAGAAGGAGAGGGGAGGRMAAGAATGGAGGAAGTNSGAGGGGGGSGSTGGAGGNGGAGYIGIVWA